MSAAIGSGTVMICVHEGAPFARGNSYVVESYWREHPLAPVCGFDGCDFSVRMEGITAACCPGRFVPAGRKGDFDELLKVEPIAHLETMRSDPVAFMDCAFSCVLAPWQEEALRRLAERYPT